VRGISLAWPANGKVIQNFNDKGSHGLTIANAEGTPVVAAAAGKVGYAGNGLRGYGNLVIVRHAGDFLSIYAHNRKLLVKEGESVRQGQPIAEMGKSDARQPELYFELRKGRTPVNPRDVLPAR
jgi:murein DD-endopeptidase MepM/ murein hydrolase activator NlpD